MLQARTRWKETHMRKTSRNSKRKKCHAATPSCWTLHGAAAGDAKFILARNAFDSSYWFCRHYWIAMVLTSLKTNLCTSGSLSAKRWESLFVTYRKCTPINRLAPKPTVLQNFGL